MVNNEEVEGGKREIEVRIRKGQKRGRGKEEERKFSDKTIC